MTTVRLTGAGQVAKGDRIQCVYSGHQRAYAAKEILNPGTDKEEVIVDVSKNKYFITSMVVDGSSWAKDVMIEKR